MTFLSKNMFQNKAAVFIAGVAITTVASAYNSNESVSNNANQPTKSVTYTASGKTDIRTAKLFQQLMQNNPNIQVTTQVIHKAKKARKRNTYVDVNYTLKGKTDRATVRKLVKLFQSNKRIEVIANIRHKPSSNQRMTNTRNIPNNYYSYQGYTIQPVTNPTIWYRVPMWTQPYPQQLDITQAPYPMDYSTSIAVK